MRNLRRQAVGREGGSIPCHFARDEGHDHHLPCHDIPSTYHVVHMSTFLVLPVLTEPRERESEEKLEEVSVVPKTGSVSSRPYECEYGGGPNGGSGSSTADVWWWCVVRGQNASLRPRTARGKNSARADLT